MVNQAFSLNILRSIVEEKWAYNYCICFFHIFKTGVTFEGMSSLGTVRSKKITIILESGVIIASLAVAAIFVLILSFCPTVLHFDFLC